MRFSTGFFATLPLISTILAAPTPQETTSDTAPTPTPTLTPTGPTYLLKTSLKPGQEAKSRYGNLYLWSYHTGAGLGDAVVSADRASGSRAFMNGTYQEFALNGASFPFGLELGPGLPYTAWNTVQINAGWGDGDYELDSESGLVVQNASNSSWGSSWGGWRVCDWNHGVTQLFWVNKYYTNMNWTMPESCADVTIIPEYL